jgi:hypothetical protein
MKGIGKEFVISPGGFGSEGRVYKRLALQELPEVNLSRLLYFSRVFITSITFSDYHPSLV